MSPRFVEVPKAPAGYGVCPYMSATVPVQTGAVVGPGGAGSVAAVTLKAACLGPECQLWNGLTSMCSHKDAWNISELAEPVRELAIALPTELPAVRRALAILAELVLAVAREGSIIPEGLECGPEHQGKPSLTSTAELLGELRALRR